jgi:cytochrome P450
MYLSEIFNRYRLCAFQGVRDCINLAELSLENVKIYNHHPLNAKLILFFLERKALSVRNEYIDNRIKTAAEKIENQDDSPDLATLLVRSKNEAGKPMFSAREIRCQLYTFIFAGHETTAGTVQWILYYLGENPDWADKICKEFESVGSKINSSTLKKVPITEAFVKETLRLAHIVDLYCPRRVKVSFGV